jgi:hypothetical protein
MAVISLSLRLSISCCRMVFIFHLPPFPIPRNQALLLCGLDNDCDDRGTTKAAEYVTEQEDLLVIITGIYASIKGKFKISQDCLTPDFFYDRSHLY